MTFTRYWKPSARVVGAGIEVTNLDDEGPRIVFEVERTTKSSPDTASVQIFGLSKARRAGLVELHRKLGALPLQVFAGYDKITKGLFFGHGTTVRDVDQVLEIVASDGSEAYQSATLNGIPAINITPAQLIGNVIAPVMRTGPLPPGIIPGSPQDPRPPLLLSAAAQQTLAQLPAIAFGTFEEDYVLAGPARELLDEVCRTIRCKWWIANGQLEIVRADRPISGLAVLLTPETGYLRSAPEQSGDLRVWSLLHPDIEPGRQMQVLDTMHKPVGAPAYRCEVARHRGDTDGGAWETESLGRALQPMGALVA